MFRLFSFLLLLWILSETSASTDATKRDLTQHKNNNANPNTPTILQQNISCDQPDADDRAHHTSRPSSLPNSWTDRLNTFSTAIIALFTFVMALAVILQVRTSRSTDRAWIIASPVERPPDVGYISGRAADPAYQGLDTRNVFAIAYRNTGNTPARLLESKVAYKRVARLQDIPSTPDYEERSSRNSLLLVKGDSLREVAILEPEAIVSEAEAIAVQSQQSFWYAYGIVVYEDAFGRTHETRFGYLYHFPLGGDPFPRGFRREGMPPTYNAAT